MGNQDRRRKRSPSEEEAPEFYYGTVDDLVREMIDPVIRRKTSSRGENSNPWAGAMVAIPRHQHKRLTRDHTDHHLEILFSALGHFDKSEAETSLADLCPLPSARRTLLGRVVSPHPSG